jgi:tripartite-type tricarboxylate transporter receptor subunit TctC
MGLAAASRMVAAGKLKGIGITSPKRSPGLPDMPTIAEQGLPGFEVVGWYGVLAPAKLPKPLLDQLHGSLLKILKMPEIQKQIFTDGAEPVGSSPEEFRRYLIADLAKWSKVVKASGAKAF